MREEIDRRTCRDKQLVTIGKLKHGDKVRLDQKKLDLERERIGLQHGGGGLSNKRGRRLRCNVGLRKSAYWP
jgi:hypothetical protein